jgi:hypothetical protein
MEVDFEQDEKETAGLVAAIQDRQGIGPNGKVDVLDIGIERIVWAAREGRLAAFLKPSKIVAAQHNTYTDKADKLLGDIKNAFNLETQEVLKQLETLRKPHDKDGYELYRAALAATVPLAVQGLVGRIQRSLHKIGYF